MMEAEFDEHLVYASRITGTEYSIRPCAVHTEKYRIIEHYRGQLSREPGQDADKLFYFMLEYLTVHNQFIRAYLKYTSYITLPDFDMWYQHATLNKKFSFLPEVLLFFLNVTISQMKKRNFYRTLWRMAIAFHDLF